MNPDNRCNLEIFRVAEQKIEKSDVISLYNEIKDLFCRYEEKCRTKDQFWRIRPYFGLNSGYADKEKDSIYIKARGKGFAKKSERNNDW